MKTYWKLGAALCALALPATAAPREKTFGRLETVATFNGPMPTGVTVSAKGRIFVNYPRWGDNVPFTVAEIRNGRTVPYPNLQSNDFGGNGDRAMLSMEKSNEARAMREVSLVSVQSVVVDPKDRLWLLDTGSIKFGPTAQGGPKLVCVNLTTNEPERIIYFPQSVALPTTYLNDVRFDLRRGKAGFAYITDSGAGSPGGIIVVDLSSGKAWRRLGNHPSTQPEPKFVPTVEGKQLFSTPPGKFPQYLGLKSDGIAISSDGSRLYYCPLASRRLYSVSTAALVDQTRSEAEVAATVVDHGDKGASDGLESDDQNRVYATLYEHNAITRRLPNGLFEPIVHDPRLLWPDTLSLARNGYLYVTANQLHRQKNFNYGKDLRQKPYSLFRIWVGAKPVLLK